jgi:hypothetical protein
MFRNKIRNINNLSQNDDEYCKLILKLYDSIVQYHNTDKKEMEFVQSRERNEAQNRKRCSSSQMRTPM